MKQQMTDPAKSVSLTIIEQLGKGFALRTGATHLTSSVRSLCFRLPNCKAKDGINVVTIMLEPQNDYTVQFIRQGFESADLRVIETATRVQDTELASTFERCTGLRLK